MAFVLSGTTSARATSPPLMWRSAKKKGAPRSYEIGLRRLGVAEQGPELIELSLNATGASARAAVIGKLTDAALRARLGDSSTHSSNEIAAIRHALAPIDGSVTLIEEWPDRLSCLLFWSGFRGLQIRPVAWVCEHCGVAAEEKIAGSVGETFPRFCGCGKSTRITLPKLGASL